MPFIVAKTGEDMMRAVDAVEKAAEILIKLAIAAALGIVGLFIGAWSYIAMAYALTPHVLPGNLGAGDLWGVVLGLTFSYVCVFGGIVLVLSSIVEKKIVGAIWLVATNLFLLAMAGFVIIAAVNARAVCQLAPGSIGSIVILCLCLGLYPAITAHKQMKRHD